MVLQLVTQGAAGDDIIQPGLIDESPTCGQNVSHTVADLSAWVPISFKKGTTNTVDAAIAAVRSGTIDANGVILDIGTVSAAPVEAALLMEVKKSGRTTGLTLGRVAAVHVTVDVRYGSRCGGGWGTGRFVDQIRIVDGTFGAGGDSGSLIVENVPTNPRPVGLLFAGGSNDTFANRIGSVLSAFGVGMVAPVAAGPTPFWRWLARLLPGPQPAFAAPPSHHSVAVPFQLLL